MKFKVTDTDMGVIAILVIVATIAFGLSAIHAWLVGLFPEAYNYVK